MNEKFWNFSRTRIREKQTESSSRPEPEMESRYGKLTGSKLQLKLSGYKGHSSHLSSERTSVFVRLPSTYLLVQPLAWIRDQVMFW